jgi:hypothetical protein
VILPPLVFPESPNNYRTSDVNHGNYIRSRIILKGLHLGWLQPFQKILDYLKMTDMDKHTSLLRYIINYDRKKFLVHWLVL